MKELEDIFSNFKKVKALVIGDVMMDTYAWGRVERISPEAPVPVLQVEKTEKRLGGAANVALNIQALGAEPILCSIVGTDSDGEDLMGILHTEGLRLSGMSRHNSRITTVKQRMISGSHQLLRVDREDTKHLNAECESILLAKVRGLLKEASVVIFEDYDKGLLGKNTIETIVGWCNEAGIPTIVDPKKENFLHYRNVSLFKPNLKEIREGLKRELNADNPADIAETVKHLKREMQLKGVLLTLSERGMYIDYEEDVHKVPAHLRSIADVSGAGDTVVSVAALCLALKTDALRLMNLANLAGGLVCEYAGVVPIDKMKLLKEAKELGY